MNPLNKAPASPKKKRSTIVEKMRAVRVFNQYEFYKDQPYMFYAKYESRAMTVAGWRVTKRGLKLDDAWYNHGCKPFHGKMKESLPDAQAWASKRFGVKAWARDPFGGYGPAEYVEARVAQLMRAAEGLAI